jgi:hypothetical protein
LIDPLIIITRLITCEGRYFVFKDCHFHLLAHFQFNKPLNFPFYFLKILEKMSSQVRKNLANPHNNLFHHGLIKLLVISELTKQSKTWDDFLYQFSNPHLTVKIRKRSVDSGVFTPPKPHSPKTPKPPVQTISLSDKKAKKIIDSPAASLVRKLKILLIIPHFLQHLLILNLRSYKIHFIKIFLRFLQRGEEIIDSRGNPFEEAPEV